MENALLESIWRISKDDIEFMKTGLSKRSESKLKSTSQLSEASVPLLDTLGM